MRKDRLDLAGYGRADAWKELCGASVGETRASEATHHFDTVDTAYRSVLGRIAEVLVDNFGPDLDELLDDYAKRKRHAAVLDFDDLLHFTRDLNERRGDQA